MLKIINHYHKVIHTPLILIYLFALVFSSCAYLRKIPDEKHYEFLYYFDRTYNNDTIYFDIANPLNCPLNIKLRNDSIHPELAHRFGHIILGPLVDTVIRIYYPNFMTSEKTNYVVRYGDLKQEINPTPIALPFPKSKSYKVIQGYNGTFSHNTLFSKYAIDFDLQIGDTITSADNGYIVGVIEDYKKYGTNKKWRSIDKSNYLTIYHPHSGLFTQYVHLDYKGSLVKLNDYVEKGQPVGISGMTGFTTTPHLHFNVIIPTDLYGFISTPIEFDNGVKGIELVKGYRMNAREKYD